MSGVLAKRAAILALWLAAAGLAAGEEGPASKDPAHHHRLGMQAYERKDHAAALRHFLAALELSPDHPRILYNAAAAGALAGEPDAALGRLERLGRMGLWYDLESDADFASLRDHPRFRAVLEEMARSRRPRGRGEIAFRLPGADTIPEGIAHDPRNGEFFVGSVHRNTIVRVPPGAGRPGELPLPDEGLWSVLGLAVDPPRGLLWACTSALPQMKGGRAGEPARGAAAAFDLAAGRWVRRVPIAGGEAGHDCNDLTVSASGDVYVSDARAGALFRIAAGSSEATALMGPGSFGSPQGLALAPGGRRLFVADYVRGIAVVDLDRRESRPLPAPDDVVTRGVDGLVLYKGALYAVQNGIRPHRVARFALDPAHSSITGVEVLEANLSIHDEPTLAVAASGSLYYVANSQWGRFEKDGVRLRQEALSEPAVLRVPLD